MLSLRHERIWLSLALVGVWACGDGAGDKKRTDDPSQTADAGGEEETCEPATGGVQDEPHAKDGDTSVLPIIFVHGFVGSASQFDSQAQRLVANDYPPSKLYAYDHHGVTGTAEQFADGLDQLVNTVLEKHKTSQFILIGHSRGTSVSNTYLGNPDRAKKVKKVVLLDGRPCGMAVPCDAPSQANLPGQAHVEVATSPESFKRWYKFLFDKEPTVVDIVKQDEPVKISGRAVNFPDNNGRKGATLNIYEIDDETGQRVNDCSLATVEIDDSGDWGPVTVDPDKHYEIVLSFDTGGFQHFYFQKFLRSTKFIRLLSGPPDSASRMNTNGGPDHAALTLIRMREWFPTDVVNVTVDVDGDLTDVGNTMPSTAPRNGIAMYLHDDKATPKMTTLAPLPYFSTQPFQAGFDAYFPAISEPEKTTITVTNHPRGDGSKPQVLTFPSWPSNDHTTMVMFSDFAQP